MNRDLCVSFYFIAISDIFSQDVDDSQQVDNLIQDEIPTVEVDVDYIKHLRRFTSTVPARGARALNRAISHSCL